MSGVTIAELASLPNSQVIAKAQCVWVVPQLSIPTDLQVTSQTAHLRCCILPVDSIHNYLPQ